MLLKFRSPNFVRVQKIARYPFVWKFVIIAFLIGTFFPGDGDLQARRVLALDENEIELPLRVRTIQFSFDGNQDSEAEVNIRDKLYPLLQEARKAGILVIHASHGKPVHPWATPLEGEMVLEDQYDAYQVFEELRNRGIKTLIYAGYATNMCVLVRPIGMIQAKEQNFNVILVRDATIAVETPESLDGEWAHKMAVRFVELNFGYTTTVEDFRIRGDKGTTSLRNFFADSVQSRLSRLSANVGVTREAVKGS
jgi:nicotinamidase-related amidase